MRECLPHGATMHPSCLISWFAFSDLRVVGRELMVESLCKRVLNIRAFRSTGLGLQKENSIYLKGICDIEGNIPFKLGLFKLNIS